VHREPFLRLESGAEIFEIKPIWATWVIEILAGTLSRRIDLTRQNITKTFLDGVDPRL